MAYAGGVNKLHSLLTGGLSLLGELTGIGRYTFEVARRIIVSEEMGVSFYYGFISSHLRTLEEERVTSRGAVLFKRALASLPPLKRSLRGACEAMSRLHPGRFDVYWEPNIAPLPVLCAKSRFVVPTVHDFSWIRNPEWHPKERREYFGRLFAKGMERADKIITVSRFVRDEAIEILGKDSSLIEVIPNGVDVSFFHPLSCEARECFREKQGLPRRFILCVGTLEPRKNLMRLAEAFRRLPSAVRSDCAMVIAGGKGWEDAEILRSLKDAGVSVLRIGYVPITYLPFLYGLAETFVFPSLYEGFGLPALEAMACGAPVVVSNTASLPEVCGDAALYVDPMDPDSIAAALERVMTDSSLRVRLGEAGVRRAALFSWDVSALLHARLFLSMCGGR